MPKLSSPLAFIERKIAAAAHAGYIVRETDEYILLFMDDDYEDDDTLGFIGTELRMLFY